MNSPKLWKNKFSMRAKKKASSLQILSENGNGLLHFN